MNDFTKEELEDIANCVWIYDDMREDEGALHAPLLKKIQSMIDNYPDIYHLPKDASIGDTINIPASKNGWIIK